MEVQLSPEQQKAVEGLAAQNGTTPADQVCRIVEDALRREADYDRWFRGQVREGRAAAKRGELLDHDVVGKMLKKQYAG